MSALSPLIPVRKFDAGDGAFVWPGRIVFATASLEDEVPLKRLGRTLSREVGSRSRVAFGAAGPADVRIRRDRRLRGEEAYRIDIDAGGIQVTSSTTAGAYYAIMTLRELVVIHGRALPAGVLRDRPDFARRGVYLDCSRGKVPTVATLKLLVETLAAFKVNEFQLYVENVFTFHRHPKIGRGFSPFTPADLLEVEAHARTHHVAFVPSLASFGHMERILALPDYAKLGELPGHLGMPGGTTLCPGDRESHRLVADLFDEYLPLFDARDFNACGDETWELGQGRSAKRVARQGVGAVYLDFLAKLHRLSTRHGKRMNVWADILLNHPETLGSLPGDVVLLNWDYTPDGARIPRTREIAEAGHAFLVCPGTSGWQTYGTRLENAIANVARFAREGRKQGAEGLLNTDWGDYGHRNPLGVSVHGYAHGAAHAWHERGVDDATFTETFAAHVLGDRTGESAAAIRAVGRAEERAGASLYHALSESLAGDRDLFRGIPRISPMRVYPEYRRRPVDEADPEGCRQVIDDRPAALPKGRTEIARLVFEDLALAGDLVKLSARWLLTGQDVRAGALSSGKDRRRLARDVRRTARAFEKNWLRHHRPSRLRDNLTLFANAAKDCESPG